MNVESAISVQVESFSPTHAHETTPLFRFYAIREKPELAVLAKDEVGDALAAVREAWEPEATARNLSLIRKGREARKNAEPWMTQI